MTEMIDYAFNCAFCSSQSSYEHVILTPLTPPSRGLYQNPKQPNDTSQNETKQNMLVVSVYRGLLVVSFHSILLAVSFYLLFRVVLYMFGIISFQWFGCFIVLGLIHAPSRSPNFQHAQYESIFMHELFLKISSTWFTLYLFL